MTKPDVSVPGASRRGHSPSDPKRSQNNELRQGRRRESLVGLSFVTPFLLVFTVFTVLPAAIAIAASFTDMRAVDLRDPLNVNVVGFESFLAVLRDSDFQQSMLNTALLTVICVPTTMALGLGFALMLDRGITRLKSMYRAAVYLPVITNIVAAAVIWQYAFSISGPVNTAAEQFGLPHPNWLGDSTWAVVTVAMMGIWRNVGTCMILYLAGLQGVAPEIYEAAATEGASTWQQMRRLTLPLLRPTTLLITVLMSIAFINMFDEPYLLTKGGPVGATRTMALWVYEQFSFGNVSYSMAGSVFLLLVVAVVSVVQFRVLRPVQ